MVKKKSSKEIIESTKRPEIEHSFIKYPGEEPVDITNYQKSTPARSENVGVKFKESHWYRPFAHIHTHPTSLPPLTAPEIRAIRKGTGLTIDEFGKFVSRNYGLPSPQDLRTLIPDDNMRTMVIAARDPKTGEVVGYQVIRKTKRSPRFGTSMKELDKHPFRTILRRINAQHFGFGRRQGMLIKSLKNYGEDIRDSMINKNYSRAVKGFDEISNEYHLKHRMIAARGYRPNELRTAFVKQGGLEQAAAATSIISLSASLFALSRNVTSSVIGNNVTQSLNWIGATLFLVGLIGAFVYFKNR